MGKIKFPIEVSGIKLGDSKTVEDGWFFKIRDIVCVYLPSIDLSCIERK